MRPEATRRRVYWVAELAKLSGSFGDDATRMTEELGDEITEGGPQVLLDHLRLCGAIPEQYGRDSSEEKLYSKYTDALVSQTLSFIGLRSVLISARSDAADVQARASTFSLVADAKSFRLSRTAKNQKDFKVQAMDGWRNGLDYAVIIGPIYQFPTRTSQIYQQAIARNVCMLSYSHLAVLVGLAMRQGAQRAEAGLSSMLRSISLLHPSKNALDYWTGVNRALVEVLAEHADLWVAERTASLQSLDVARKEALCHLCAERNRLLGLSHEQALQELIRLAGLDARMAQVERVAHGSLLENGA